VISLCNVYQKPPPEKGKDSPQDIKQIEILPVISFASRITDSSLKEYFGSGGDGSTTTDKLRITIKKYSENKTIFMQKDTVY